MNKKDIIVVLAVVATAVSLRAQSPYVSPLDTIVGHEITYFYNNDNWQGVCPDFWYATVGTKGEGASRFYTDTTLRVKGLAICAKPLDPSYIDTIGGMPFFYSDSVFRLKIYEAGDSMLIPLASQIVNMNITDRWMEVTGYYRGELPFGQSYSPWPGYGDWIIPVTEVLFDSVVTVDDSFYVGFAPIHPNKDLIFAYSQLLWSYIPNCRFVGMAEYDIETNRWRYGPINYTWFVFPIIDSTGWYLHCDTMVCPEVEGFNVSTEYVMAVCSWFGDTLSGHGEWQLSYGPVGTEPEDGRIVTTTALSRVLDGLEDTVEYVVYVRGYCTACRKWSAWSDGRVFRLPSVEGVRGPGEVERGVQVVPNPAHGRVAVTATSGLRRVTLYDALGTTVMDRRVKGRTTELDLGGLVAGMYVVEVVTDGGTVCRRLVVE